MWVFYVCILCVYFMYVYYVCMYVCMYVLCMRVCILCTNGKTEQENKEGRENKVLVYIRKKGFLPSLIS
jgi:hypothetical protein